VHFAAATHAHTTAPRGKPHARRTAISQRFAVVSREIDFQFPDRTAAVNRVLAALLTAICALPRIPHHHHAIGGSDHPGASHSRYDISISSPVVKILIMTDN
jgi:hypothetical protein